jgi:hypothetical protein
VCRQGSEESGRVSDAEEIVTQVVASCELDGGSIAPWFREVLLKVAAGEMTADEAIQGERDRLAEQPEPEVSTVSAPTRSTVATALDHEPFCRWPCHQPCCGVTVEDCTCNVTANIKTLVTCGWLQLELGPPLYPGTKFLTLCTLEGRKDGAVTVGESRLPVAGVLATVRALGAAEAAIMWPSLTADELAVLERLIADMDECVAGGTVMVDAVRAELAARKRTCSCPYWPESDKVMPSPDCQEHGVEELDKKIMGECAIGEAEWLLAELENVTKLRDAAEQRLALAQEALVADGYFTQEQVDADVAPRITELCAHLRSEIESLRESELADIFAKAESWSAPGTMAAAGDVVSRENVSRGCRLPTAAILDRWRPGSGDWDWPAEWAELAQGDAGMKLAGLIGDIAANGIKVPVLLGDDGRVWDGHNRLMVARLLGIEDLAVTYGHGGDQREGNAARDVVSREDFEFPNGCPTPRDEDCDVPCHETHLVPYKRSHDPDSCPGLEDQP